MAVVSGDSTVGETGTQSPTARLILGVDRLTLDVAGSPALPLDVAGLVLLEALGRQPGAASQLVDEVARQTGGDPDALRELVVQLRGRGVVGNTGDRGEVDALPVRTESTTSIPPIASTDVALLVATVPLVLRVSAGSFEYVDHEGVIRERLGPAELAAASVFQRPKSKPAAFEQHTTEAGAAALDETQFDALVDRLMAVSLLGPFEDDGAEERRRRLLLQRKALVDTVERKVAEHEAMEREREQRTGTKRVKVIPADVLGSPIPLALGMILAYASAYKDGALGEHYQFVPEWITTSRRLPALTEEPGIFLFSNYIWSHTKNLAMSRRLKQANPSIITVHGGPDTPKYEGDVEAYFRTHPQVDVTVRGEGEVTTAEMFEALIGVFEQGDGEHRPDLSALRDVPGLCFRDGDRVVRTEDRDRLVDLDSVPSPFLTGMFDVHGEAIPLMAIVETNRGCPYGCTFCDWGSATLSRIRKFSLDRVFAELEWCAAHEVTRVYIADANFGILERDVEIAEKVAELKMQYGYPKLFSTNYAKNTAKHLKHIVMTLAGAGILTEGLLSLQSMDAGTLNTIRRHNIKVEKYDDLAKEFRKAKLPLFIDLMMGLPGATPESFKSDIQGCIDREVTAKIFPTELLVNSPMNDPAYRAEHKIETSSPPAGLVRTPSGQMPKRALLVSTSSYTREDYEEMMRLRRIVLLSENFGVLRQVSRFVRQEHGMLEAELYDRLRVDLGTRPERWPTIAFAYRTVPDIGVPPLSWRLFVDEIEDYLTTNLGMVSDDALRTVLAVQHALLPARERRFPMTLDLPHDYAKWHSAMVEAKDDGYRDWTGLVPRLADLAPASFTIDDPHQVCSRGVGYNIEDHYLADWELDSPVARSLPAEHLAN